MAKEAITIAGERIGLKSAAFWTNTRTNKYKAVSHKHRAIFVAIPKTGSGSIRSILRDDGTFGFYKKHEIDWSMLDTHLEHIYLKAITREAMTKYHGYKKAAFVRNPFDRLVSLWKWSAKPLRRLRLVKRHRDLRPLVRWNFNDFLNFLIDHEPHQFRQLNWTEGDDIKVFRFENLEEDTEKLCQYFGIENTGLKGKNRTDHGYYVDYYSHRTRRVIETLCKDDICYFGYRFTR